MKKISVILVVIFSVSFVFTSCEKGDIEPIEQKNILPENFRVEIPASLMSDATKSLKNTKSGELKGNEIYEHLTTFISVGNEAAKIVSDIITAIPLYNLSQAQEFDFEGDDDGRIKHVIVVENSSFEGKVWQYQLTITDKLSEGNEDGGMGIQIFWDKDPIDGIAILKPYNINRNEIPLFAQSIFRIDYSETSTNYEQEMTVYVAGLQTDLIWQDKYAMETMKMNVGKNGNLIEVYGNSNHPNANFYTTNTGFNWSFVAAGSNVSEIGVAEVGLPSSDLNTTDRTVILKDNSLKDVLSAEVTAYFVSEWGLTPTQQQLDEYLGDAEAPGYFNNAGFVQGGTSPGAEYDVFETAINGLTPYNPVEVSNLTIAFKTE